MESLRILMSVELYDDFIMKLIEANVDYELIDLELVESSIESVGSYYRMFINPSSLRAAFDLGRIHQLIFLKP